MMAGRPACADCRSSTSEAEIQEKRALETALQANQ